MSVQSDRINKMLYIGILVLRKMINYKENLQKKETKVHNDGDHLLTTINQQKCSPWQKN